MSSASVPDFMCAERLKRNAADISTDCSTYCLVTSKPLPPAMCGCKAASELLPELCTSRPARNLSPVSGSGPKRRSETHPNPNLGDTGCSLTLCAASQPKVGEASSV